MVTKENRTDRLNRLGREGARCDGNSRSCVNRAVEIFDVVRMDGHGTRLSDEILQKQTCGYHRVQFDKSSMYNVVGRRPLSRRHEIREAAVRLAATQMDFSDRPNG